MLLLPFGCCPEMSELAPQALAKHPGAPHDYVRAFVSSTLNSFIEVMSWMGCSSAMSGNARRKPRRTDC